MTRRLAVIGAIALVVGVWFAIGRALPVQQADASRADAPLRLAGPLPAWRAPGGRLSLAGWAGARAPVRLLADGHPIGRARAGPLGRFVLTARAPRRGGRYRLELASAGRRVQAGRLVVRPIVLAAAGDVNLGDRTADAIAAHGLRYPWTSVAPVLRDADLAVANLECAVSRGGEPAVKEYTFRGSPAALAAVGRAGIDVLSLANNHSVDYGPGALLDTIRHARRAGIATVGGGADLAFARRPVRVELGGVRIALLAYSDVRPLGFDAGEGQPGAAPAFAELLDPDIRRAKRAADVVVVYFHWGTELATTPDSRQKRLADLAFRAGATIVLGAHPHVLQPVQRGGSKLVAWSLGNFVFPARSAGTTATGILLAHLGAGGVLGQRLVPATIRGVRPVLATPSR
jgi:poly-gamma-glutamate capsule biosynthesis protein CapA/YwtB (metallophosphatase superfamily)